MSALFLLYDKVEHSEFVTDWMRATDRDNRRQLFVPTELSGLPKDEPDEPWYAPTTRNWSREQLQGPQPSLYRSADPNPCRGLNGHIARSVPGPTWQSTYGTLSSWWLCLAETRLRSPRLQYWPRSAAAQRPRLAGGRIHRGRLLTRRRSSTAHRQVSRRGAGRSLKWILVCPAEPRNGCRDSTVRAGLAKIDLAIRVPCACMFVQDPSLFLYYIFQVVHRAPIVCCLAERANYSV